MDEIKMDEIKKHEIEVLRILNNESAPMGSGQLRKLLVQKGFKLSEATVGRILSEMDQKNLTIKYGYRGRLISERGRELLEAIDHNTQLNLNSARFIRILNSQRQEDLIDMLVARRAIERELASLAAVKATDAEISLMEAVLREQERLAAQNEMSAEQDARFHRLIATAAKNKVLAAALDLIRQGRQMSMILEYIRREVRGTLAVEHARILRAIINRDPAGAEQAMVDHIESLMSDVHKYWRMTRLEM
ncbi:FCD domain-containing protein [Desulfofundulus thermocisternus]|uniref:FCD domain-containing protein n=1 Tax=Desulfofundulus thermocisternus TaxID=42471 RepID=UPI0019F97BDD|nr:FCD domain-containing protein [Desulfofundulus thermocisternus]MBE3586925.1 FCD domain-containing protein [Thermoanaerobacter sp.]MCS5695642.1 FCD domain-containing protein [Desulfofundulus thermocisternus]